MAKGKRILKICPRSRAQRRKEAKDCRKRNNVDLKGFLPSMPSIGISEWQRPYSSEIRKPFALQALI